MQPEHYNNLLEFLAKKLKDALKECHEIGLDIGDVRDTFESALQREYDGDYRHPR